jgi:hypothetical protein
MKVPIKYRQYDPSDANIGQTSVPPLKQVLVLVLYESNKTMPINSACTKKTLEKEIEV